MLPIATEVPVKQTICLNRYRRLLLLSVVVMLLSVTGCAKKILLQAEDVVDKAWLRPLVGGFDGFVPVADGRLLMVNHPAMKGERWALQEDQLLLWTDSKRSAEAQSLAYRARLDGDDLVLLTSEGNDTLVYTSMKTAEPLNGVPYFPFYLKNPRVSKLPISQESIYLQFNIEEKSVRGFGGVNNFQSQYQRFGSIGFKSEPVMSTMMSGPGMDCEMLLLSCLNHADTVISLENFLFFYQGKELLGSFRAE